MWSSLLCCEYKGHIKENVTHIPFPSSSQWTTMLDKIEDALEMAGIHYERLDGTMKREERNRSLDALKNDPKCEVLLGM
jgi:SNF2 family DNA or RNA helicase